MADAAAFLRSALRSGTLAGLAMVPFGLAFRSQGMRINEYGRKTLELLLGGPPAAPGEGLMFVQHLVISWIAALPVLPVLARIDGRAMRVAAGAIYGTAFYVAVNSLALPLAFGDETPWQLGWRTVAPSLTVHLVYGVVLGAVSPGPCTAAARTSPA